MLWSETGLVRTAVIISAIGANIYPFIFGPICLILGAYLITVLLWAIYHKRKSKKLGLKVTFLLPCEHRLFSWLAKRNGIKVMDSMIWELHLDTKVSYQGECSEVKEQFQKDLEHDLRLIEQLRSSDKLGSNPTITLNTFNRFWLQKTTEILGGIKYPGVVLTQTSCGLYSPQKHLKTFKKMFPTCTLKEPGRQSPEQWDLIVSTKGER